MAANIAALLDKAKDIHNLPSDYKLALVMGVSHRSLASYRHGMTLPDARVISKLCDLTGDDPAVILAEVEEQRATTTEAKALWHQVAVRLQQAAAAGVFSVVAAVALAVGLPSGEARADTLKPQLQILYIVELMRLVARALFRRLRAPAVRTLKVDTGRQHVPCTASIAAA